MRRCHRLGIAASIRIVNPQSLKKENFVDGGTATGEMLDFLAECLRYGISICVAGATSSGKTTLAGCPKLHPPRCAQCSALGAAPGILPSERR